MDNTIYTKIAKNTANGYNDTEVRLANANALKNVLSDLTLENYKQFLTHIFYNWCPDYFFTTPASSTGKYHPGFANRSNGLLLHSVAVVKFAMHLLEIVEHTEKDLNNIVIAAFAHDLFKYGDPETYSAGQYTKHGHPEYAAKFFLNEDVKKIASDFNISDEDMNFISSIIATHMGPWTTNKYDPIVLKAPESKFEMLLHKADLFASFKEGAVVTDLL